MNNLLWVLQVLAAGMSGAPGDEGLPVRQDLMAFIAYGRRS